MLMNASRNDHSTIYRWPSGKCPKMEKRLRELRNLPDSLPVHMEEPRDIVIMLSVFKWGRRQLGRTVHFVFLPSTAKLHTGFWVNHQEEAAEIRDSSIRIKRLPMVAASFCSNAKAGARLTLNNDRQVPNNVIERGRGNRNG